MASEEDLAEDGTSSPAAGTSQVPQAAPLDASEDLTCPICRDAVNDEASVAWCRHTFCFSCILERSRRRAVRPICQRPFRYICRKVGASNYEVRHIAQRDSSGSHARGGRPRPRSAERRRRRRSSGRQRRGSSGGDRSGGRAGSPERGRSRSPRRHRDGRGRVRHARGYDPSSSRRRRQSRARDAARDEGRAPRPERDAPSPSGRSDRRQRAGRASSRERRATGSRPRRRSRSPAGRRAW